MDKTEKMHTLPTMYCEGFVYNFFCSFFYEFSTIFRKTLEMLYLRKNVIYTEHNLMNIIRRYIYGKLG